MAVDNDEKKTFENLDEKIEKQTKEDRKEKVQENAVTYRYQCPGCTNTAFKTKDTSIVNVDTCVHCDKYLLPYKEQNFII